MVIQVNGKTRDVLNVEKNLKQTEIDKLIMKSSKANKHLMNKKIIKTIFIKNKSGGYNIGYNKKFNDFKGFNDAFAFLKGEFRLKKIPISYSTKYHLEGIWKSNWEVILRSNYYLRKETGDTVRSNKLLNLTFTSSAKNPEYIFHSFSGNHHQWENNFKPVSLNKANLELFFKSITTIVDVEIQNVSNYIYFDQNSLPQQTKKNITAGKIHVKNQFGKKHLWIM